MIPKLIIFDFDGVIVNSEDVLIESLHTLLKDYKIDMSFEECCQTFIGNDTIGTLNEVITKYKSKGNSKEIFNKLLEIKNNLLINIKKTPYIEDLLQNLVNLKISYCIASNSSLEHINTVLKIVKLDNFFNNNKFSAVDLNKFKPDPEVYLHALKQMGFSAQDSLVIEDSVPGATAAYRANLPLIGLLSSSFTDKIKYSKLLKKAGAFRTTDTLQCIIDLVNKK